MNFINEQYVARIKRSKQACKVSRLVQYRTGRDFHVYAQFFRYYMGKGRLSKAGRPVKQYMIQGLPSHEGGLHENLQIVYDFVLT